MVVCGRIGSGGRVTVIRQAEDTERRAWAQAQKNPDQKLSWGDRWGIARSIFREAVTRKRSGGDLFYIAVQGILTVATIGGPMWGSAFATSSSVGWGNLCLASGIVAALIAADRVFRQFHRLRRAGGRRYPFLAAFAASMHGLREMVGLRPSWTPERVESQARQILRTIQMRAQMRFPEEPIRATLLRFSVSPKGDEWMVEKWLRHDDGDSQKESVPLRDTVAGYSALLNQVLVEHDFRKRNHPFPKKSFSGSSPHFRSLLTMPIADADPSCRDRRRIPAVLAIDSSTPFLFWQDKGHELQRELGPCIFHLKLILEGCDGLKTHRDASGAFLLQSPAPEPNPVLIEQGKT